MKHLHQSFYPNDVWQLFYQNPPQSTPIKGKNIAAKTSQGECFLYESVFIKTTFNSAITFTVNNCKFLISDCSFTECSSSNSFGGAIQFVCDSSIVQYRTCAYKSQTTSDRGHHSYIDLLYTTNNINYVYESSFYECGNIEKDDVNYMHCGIIDIKSINTSFCKSQYGAGIVLFLAKSIKSVAFSSFCNITATYSIIYSDRCKYNFTHCNVLSNHRNIPSHGTYFAPDSIIIIENCSFLDNSGSVIEFFQSGSGSIIVINSFCDKQVGAGNVVFTNVQNSYSVHNLPLFSSYTCEAKNPIMYRKVLLNTIHILKLFKSTSKRKKWIF